MTKSKNGMVTRAITSLASRHENPQYKIDAYSYFFLSAEQFVCNSLSKNYQTATLNGPVIGLDAYHATIILLYSFVILLEDLN